MTNKTQLSLTTGFVEIRYRLKRFTLKLPSSQRLMKVGQPKLSSLSCSRKKLRNLFISRRLTNQNISFLETVLLMK